MRLETMCGGTALLLLLAGDKAGEAAVLPIPRPERLDPAAAVIELCLAGPPAVMEPTPLAKAE